jgi:flagellar biosynthesis protein FlhA
MKDISIGDIQLVMQNLLKEGVAVRDLKTILETMSVQAKINKNPSFLTEHVRQALSRNICKQNLADTGELFVITLSPDIENTIAKGASPDGTSVTLDPSFTRMLFDKLNVELEKAITATGNQPVILCSSPIRFLFRKLVERTYPQIAIMSYNEISPNVKVKSVGMVKIEAAKK